MSRSQALSLRCAEPGGKSRQVQIQSLTMTSGPVLCEAPAPSRPPASFPPHPGGGLLHLYKGLGDFCQDRALLYQGLRLWTQETGPEGRGCTLQRRQRWWTPHTGQEEALCWQQDLLLVLRGPREQSLGAKPHW
ncbi:hypothetical protein CapIbe_014584 [Capra ibex]